MSDMPNPNVGADLIRIHKVITRGLEVSIENSTALARDGFPDQSTREGFTSYARALVAFTTGHHITEDHVAFPYFRGLMPEAPFDTLIDEHLQMTQILDRMEAAVEAIASNQEAGPALASLGAELVQFSDLWHRHIALEELYLSPAEADELMPVEEQLNLAQQMSKYSQEHAGPDYLLVPFLLYNLEPPDRAVLEAVMPPIVTQQLVPVTWKDQWAPMAPFLLD